MRRFTIYASESWLKIQNGDSKQRCLQFDTTAFYHDEYQSHQGRHDIEGTIENLICTFKENNPQNVQRQLLNILNTDLPEILRISGYNPLMVCVIPRSKQEEHYNDNEIGFRKTIQQYVLQNRHRGFVDGTHNIIRHSDTATTHLTHNGGTGGGGDMPYCGITKNTCNIIGVRGQNILLIDDLYTKTVGIDEDAIQALYDNGAHNVIFYSVGKTVNYTNGNWVKMPNGILNYCKSEAKVFIYHYKEKSSVRLHLLSKDGSDVVYTNDNGEKRTLMPYVEGLEPDDIVNLTDLEICAKTNANGTYYVVRRARN